MPAFPMTLPALAAVSYSAALAVFMLDPMLARIVSDLDADADRAFLVTTAFALPYALAQPFIGALADQLGRVKVMLTSLAAAVIATALGAAAPSLDMLIVSRFAAGFFTAGASTLCFAVAGDLLSETKRQIGFSRISAAGVGGSLSGAIASGLVADLLHWRAAILIVAAAGALSLAGAFLVLQSQWSVPPRRFVLKEAATAFGSLFRIAGLRWCFAAQMVATGLMMGLFPHIAFLVASTGDNRAFVVSTILAGFMVGSILYGLAAGLILGSLGRVGAMRCGGVLVAAALVAFGAPPDPALHFSVLVAAGIGYRALQNPLHTFAAEVAPALRGSALALYAMFSVLGQSIAPLAYARGFAVIGTMETLIIASTLFAALALLASRLLRPSQPSA
ncbi:MFS transporter [Microvirga alba]|uniref:MFS transporter n=1 Tax=Microvirga alba TaxID=2791025 RepID=A0A931FS80_9HYPH|nr:MFS transporter [Microvirga alba]MBF9235328.1 MFS transporter [Microvirga alba]